MKKNNFFLIVFLTFMAGIISCEDTRLDHISDPAVYIPASGEIERVIYSTGEPFIYRLGIHQSGVQEVEASATVVIMSETELEAYNTENKTSYKRLPDNSFELKGGNSAQVRFSKDSRLEFVEIEIFYDEIENLPGYDLDNSENYVIPVMISHADIHIGENNRSALIKPLIREPNLYFSSIESSIKVESVDDEYTESIRISLDFENLWDISIQVGIDEDAVESYNILNGTQYKLLPAATYTLTPMPLVIEPGSNSVVIEFELIAENVDFDDFLLPISIQEVSRFTVAPEYSTHYLMVSRSAERFNRSGWTIADFSTEEATGEGAGQGVAVNVLDGNTNTFWHSQWAGGTGQLPHHITIDMQKEVTVTGIDLQRRVNNGDTRAGNFYISSDNETFTHIGDFEMAASNEAQTFRVTTTQGRYVKVEITESNRAPFANFAEIYIRGVE